MKDTNKESLNIFCSISQERLSEVNNLLIPSLEKQDSEIQVFLTFINYKADSTISLKDIKTNNLKFNILNPKKPLGFGESHNYAFSQMKPKDFFLIINPDIYMQENCLKELLRSYNARTGLVEARQLPFTHPKDAPHKKTFETNWASGCCLLINSNFFKKAGGFDPNYWMYLEDVDLSWKAWINNFQVIQNPKAVVYHFTGIYFKYSENTYEIEDFWSMRNFFYLSYVYFGKKGLKRARKIVNSISFYDKEIKEAAYKNFSNLNKTKQIEHIEIPNELTNKIKIYDYNKFSKHPI